MKKYMRVCPRCGNTYESDLPFTPFCKACHEDIGKMHDMLLANVGNKQIEIEEETKQWNYM